MIPLHDLEKITNNFSEDLKVGGGGYGDVYKAVYKGKKIAVKLLHTLHGIDDGQFMNELSNLMRVQHINIVRLVDYCYEVRCELVKQKDGNVFGKHIYRVLCFEYMEGGSLEKHLFEESGGHDWPTRCKIIKGICAGLYSLHGEWGHPILHLDLKPANILLDEYNVPKIADFGLSTIYNESRTHLTVETVSGTMKYMPPEMKYMKQMSQSNDIFSLGVIIIDVMTGPTGYNNFNGMEVGKFTNTVLTKWWNRITATSAANPGEQLYQVEKCIKIAIRCLDRERNNRPNITAIVQILNQIGSEVPMSQNLSTSTKLGPWGSGEDGSPRDITEKPWRLESLTIRHLGVIDLFAFSYIDQAGQKHTAGPWGSNLKSGYSLNDETIQLGPSEFLKEVSGKVMDDHYNETVISSLTFVTNVQTYGPFGYHPGTRFTANVPENRIVVGFFGRSGHYLNSIGVYTRSILDS